ncbi:SbcC/MukB-like Walker B domain-containing protein, partial [Actinomycetospora chlora]|uniref:SbcC/MukB-like Walker B domain-containing protein n=1 Tax=Actinomycetospora chlora TaxID=663608 RepID=UPI0031EDE285
AEQADAGRRAARAAAEEHRGAVASWVEGVRAHVVAVPPAEPDGPSGWLAPSRADEGDEQVDDLRRAADRCVRAARAEADGASAELADARSRAGTRAEAVDVELAGLRAEHARVEAATELPLPRASWRTDPHVADAELFAAAVDFRPEVDDAARAGLEAALEASGLLTAHVRDDGTLRGTDGELLVAPGDAGADDGLHRWLVPADTGAVTPDVVSRVLAAVGTTPGPGLWVADDGSFGAGPLRGRHAKPAAEHVGAGARAQARARRLAELAALTSGAEERLSAARTVLAALDEHAATLRAMVRELPTTRTVDDAVAAATGAVRYADEAQARAAQQASAAVEARRRADDAEARLRQEAGGAGLPTDPARLEEMGEAVGDAERALAAVEAARERTHRSVRTWRDAVTAWERDGADHAAALAAHRSADEHAVSVRTELETIEAALGEEPAKVAARVAELDDQLRDLVDRLEAARGEKEAAAVAVAQAEGQVETATATAAERETAVRAGRRRLAEVVETPGLLAAAERAVDRDDEPVPATADTLDGAQELVAALRERLPAPRSNVSEDALEKALRTARDALTGGGRDIESRRSADGMPVAVFVTSGSRATLAQMVLRVAVQQRQAEGLLSTQQDQALRNLLHGRIAREVADALFAARELVDRMNRILRGVTSSQGIGVRLQWRPRSDLDADTATALELLGTHPDLREPEDDDRVREAVKGLVEQARAENPEASYRTVIGEILDYRTWHEMRIYLRRPGRSDELLTRRTTLSEGEKKLVTVLPMASAAAASAAAHDPHGVGAPRLVLLDDAFAKVSEDNHAKLFGLLVDLDVDFVVTSERLWGTHANVPALAITEVLRDPELRAIALVHYRWNGSELAVSA